MNAISHRQLVVEDLGGHAADRAATALRDVVLLGETPKERATIAIIALCGVLGATAGFVADAFKDGKPPGLEIDGDTAVRLTLQQLVALTEAGTDELREFSK